MSQDVVQWLNEIKELKQQLQQARHSEEAAHASAENWRKRYEIEAQQRRSDVEFMQHAIDELRTEVERLKNLPQSSAIAPDPQVAIGQTVNALQTIPELQAKLIEVWGERDYYMGQSQRLAQDLEAEQANHAQTRKNLTTALGDAVDMLAKANDSELD